MQPQVVITEGQIQSRILILDQLIEYDGFKAGAEDRYNEGLEKGWFKGRGHVLGFDDNAGEGSSTGVMGVSRIRLLEPEAVDLL